MAKERPKRQGIMLAYPYDQGRLARIGKHFLLQPKINGERCIVEWFAGEPVLLSSYGNEFKFLDHLKKTIKKMGEKLGPVPLDGEIYTHGWTRERIDSALRRSVNKSPDNEGLNYHVFDIRSGEGAFVRMAFLQELARDGWMDEPSPLKYVPTTVVSDEDWLDLAMEYIEDGYEGAIIRKINAPWEPKRSVNMLKFKPTEKDVYEIVDINEAIDKHGFPKGMVGSFTVRSDTHQQVFKVGAGKMPHSLRVEIWRSRKHLIGKYLIVKHEPMTTSGGVPLCAVAVDILRKS